MEILQKELDTIRMDWNQHRVRKSNGSVSPSGKPDIMYSLPNLYGKNRRDSLVFHDHEYSY